MPTCGVYALPLPQQHTEILAALNSALLNVAETLSPRAAIFLSDHNTNINKIDLVLFIIVMANSRLSWYFPSLEDSTGAQNE